MAKEGEVVCVTGGSGSIGSWLVRGLLDHGYIVHATVQDLKNESEPKHLESLEGAETRLHLFQIELLDYASILRALTSCAGVFHLASPCIVDQVHDPEKLKMDNSQNASYQAGQVQGQTQEKASNMMDKAVHCSICQGIMSRAGQQVKAKAQGAADAIKDTIGAKK